MTTIDVDSATVRLLSAAVDLPFPHDLVLRTARMAAADASPTDLVEAIEEHPVLAQGLLGFAGAGVFADGAKPATVAEAVAAVGVGRAANTVAMLSFADLLSYPERGDSDFRRALSTRSLIAGVAARAISQRTSAAADHEAFVAGMLVGSGQLVAALALPGIYEEVMKDAANPLPLPREERERLGFDHGVLDAALARHWGQPIPIAAAIGAATAPDRLPLSAGPKALRLSEALHTAFLTARVVCDRDEAPPMVELGHALTSRIGLGAGGATAFLRSLAASAQEFAQLLNMRLLLGLDLEQIATDADEAITSLHARTANESDERKAGFELEDLKVDQITGLPDATNLPHLTQIAFDRQTALGLPETVGILAIEVDGLEIERAGGSGDGLLREVARRLSARIRTSDILLRGNHDQLLLLAPSTSPSSLGDVGNRLCGAVREPDGEAAFGSRPLTISVGGACAANVRRGGERDLLIEEAGLECTAAKELGGDRCQIKRDD